MGLNNRAESETWSYIGIKQCTFSRTLLQQEMIDDHQGKHLSGKKMYRTNISLQKAKSSISLEMLDSETAKKRVIIFRTK